MSVGMLICWDEGSVCYMHSQGWWLDHDTLTAILPLAAAHAKCLGSFEPRQTGNNRSCITGPWTNCPTSVAELGGQCSGSMCGVEPSWLFYGLCWIWLFCTQVGL